MSTIAYLSKSDQVRSKKPIKKHKQAKNKKFPTPTPIGEHICARCGKSKYLEIHHVFPAANRNNSSIYGCVEWLCYHCHRDYGIGAHGGNEKLNAKLKRKHQLKLMNDGMSLDKFIEIFGRTYIVS